jgi:hypothetical protein
LRSARVAFLIHELPSIRNAVEIFSSRSCWSSSHCKHTKNAMPGIEPGPQVARCRYTTRAVAKPEYLIR